VPLTGLLSEGVFQAAVRERVDAVIVFTHGFAVLNRARIIEHAARRGLPTMYGWREFVSDGGLMSYGPNVPEMVRRRPAMSIAFCKAKSPAISRFNNPLGLNSFST
jgi:putative tryptophan/tyrosine transport system substrate-binding protein